MVCRLFNGEVAGDSRPSHIMLKNRRLVLGRGAVSDSIKRPVESVPRRTHTDHERRHGKLGAGGTANAML